MASGASELSLFRHPLSTRRKGPDALRTWCPRGACTLLLLPLFLHQSSRFTFGGGGLILFICSLSFLILSLNTLYPRVWSLLEGECGRNQI